MKICAIICEYNPFHNGHKYLIEQAKILSGCDAVLCLMSGSFTQRGEAAILPKFLRAEHAVKGGADCVIQLPAAFSVAPAEIFASGAISILKRIPAVKCLAFGSENADCAEIAKAVDIMSGEKFNKAVAENLESGTSYKRSLSSALQKFGADEKLVTSPNGVLALEYAKAIKNTGADIKILPIQRKGAGFNDSGLKDEFSSASAIRANLNDEKVAENVPPYVFEALQKTDTVGAALRADALIRYALAESEKKDLARIFGCSEGLENKLKADMNLTAEELIACATNKRYTSSRIRRILTANMLKLYSDDVKSYISEGTYIRPLAIRGSLKDEIFAEFARSELPVIIKKMSLAELTDGNCAARNCYSADLRADFVRALIFNESPEYEYTVRII